VNVASTCSLYPTVLPLVHRLVPLRCQPCRIKRLKSHARVYPPLDKAAILPYEVVRILQWSQFTTLRKNAFLPQLVHLFRKSRIAADVDAPKSYGMLGVQGFAEETLGSLSVTHGAEHELQCLTVRVNRPVPQR